MKKVVGVVGYKNSGKTTLTHALAQELVSRGRTVAVIKHTSHQVDVAEKDTATLLGAVGQVVVMSDDMMGIFRQGAMSLEDALAYLDADIVLVEGFKGEKTYPKIACLRGEADDADLLDGLVIAVVGLIGEVEPQGIPTFDRDDVSTLADRVDTAAFKLPSLDCKACGHETCYDMAREIVAGTGSVEECVSLQPAVEVTVDGEPIALNPFISGIVQSTVLGLLSSLKGFRQGRVEIRLGDFRS
jgi:molybdopterin-guanine dinucleotide biosynthesis protein B